MASAGFTPMRQHSHGPMLVSSGSYESLRMSASDSANRKKNSFDMERMIALRRNSLERLDEMASDSDASLYEEDYIYAEHMEDALRRSAVRKQMERGRCSSHSVYCKGAVSIVVFVNTLVIAGEAMCISSKFAIFDCLEICFTLFYVIEIGFRLWEVGFCAFISEHDWAWNLFDMIITALSVLDTVEEFADGGTGSGASVGRLFRIFRILRMFRAMRFMNEVDYVLVTAAKATMKLGVVVSLFIFVFSIIATNLLWDSEDPLIVSMFGNLGSSMWSMFKLMTLDDWVPVAEKVIAEKPAMAAFFVLFIFSTSIALISLVPAIFIEISLNSKDKLQQFAEEKRKAEHKRKQLKLLRTLFKLVDIDNNGSTSLDEMKRLLSDEKALRTLQENGLTKMGELRDVRLGLFDLWEERLEESGCNYTEISEEEFLVGLLRSGHDISQRDVWRSATTVRLMLRDLASFVHKENHRVHQELNQIKRNQKKDLKVQTEQGIDCQSVLQMIRELMEAYRKDMSREVALLARGRHGDVHPAPAAPLTPERPPGEVAVAPVTPNSAASQSSHAEGTVSSVVCRLGLSGKLASMLKTTAKSPRSNDGKFPGGSSPSNVEHPNSDRGSCQLVSTSEQDEELGEDSDALMDVRPLSPGFAQKYDVMGPSLSFFDYCDDSISQRVADDGARKPLLHPETPDHRTTRLAL